MKFVLALVCLIAVVSAQHHGDTGVHNPDGGNHHHPHPDGCSSTTCDSTVCPTGTVAQCHHGGICSCDLPA